MEQKKAAAPAAGMSSVDRKNGNGCFIFAFANNLRFSLVPIELLRRPRDIV